jgi:flagellar basal body rod protein FlgB
MDLSSLIRDNIDDILVKIIQFTHIRHCIIADNIKNCRSAGFVPRHVDVEDFAKVISVALAEHQRSKKLSLCDSHTITFSFGGKLDVKPEMDIAAQKLFVQDFRRYILLQKQRLKENIVNNKTACALLRHKRQSADMAAI